MITIATMSTAQRRLINNLYGDMGWEVPRLLTELETADDLYLDSISTIVMDTWTRGRVTLVGDAGYSPGPAVGGGTSLAVVGAYVLASELAASSGDHVRGLAAYEQVLRPAVQHSQKIGPAVHEDADSTLASASVGDGTGDPAAPSAARPGPSATHLLRRRSRSHAGRGAAARPQGCSMSKPTILTVDDDPQVSAAITRDLANQYGADYRIVRASSGREASTY